MTGPCLNSLARASSSYLRSAMHQPIRWHEWGEEAFAAARRENKPMLLDIGAVWCHWCHVMDRESYDDPEIAKIVNDDFIAVKVDRDERPDIDSRYQLAVSALSGQGGWPLTAFLTPDGKPFYGGTYFPPQDHYGRPSFRRVLLSIAHAYREQNGDVLQQASMVESAIARAESYSKSDRRVSASVIDALVESAQKMFDRENGGFGSAPKFPHPSAIDVTMHACVGKNEGREKEEIRNLFIHTLEKMARGGVYDQLAGGFHRYSVDERWIVPHFEKMSYDNSELLKNYVHAWQVTGDEFFADVVRDIIHWMDEWLSDRSHGGFYASQDADYSMDDDGDYFTWTLDEARAALTEEEAKVAELRFDIREIGDMHHNPAKNVLHIRASVEEIGRRLNLTAAQVDALLDSARKKMYAARLQRPTPYVDKTIYTGWNAMCVSAYLAAANALELKDARTFALRSLDRLLAEGWRAAQPSGAKENGVSPLRHVIAYSDPNSERRETAGVLDDYTFTIIACLDAYEATAELTYFRFARTIAEAMIAGFYDEVDGGFFDTRKKLEDAGSDRSSNEGSSVHGILGAPRKPFQDSPTPAGNPSAAIALLRLHSYTNEASYRDKAEATLELYAGATAQHGIFAATYGLAVARFMEPHTQVVVVGNDESARNLHKIARGPFSLTTAVLCLDRDKSVPQNLPPALADTIPHLPALREQKSFAVVCSNFTCQPPVFDAEELATRLAALPRQAA
ncbi:MAG TPA: thioredoxin domain-containing protein [Terriglobales bacterium]|nr:thioredoxin domain-containing protein [Terriglobales bacterium]